MMPKQALAWMQLLSNYNDAMMHYGHDSPGFNAVGPQVYITEDDGTIQVNDSNWTDPGKYAGTAHGYNLSVVPLVVGGTGGGWSEAGIHAILQDVGENYPNPPTGAAVTFATDLKNIAKNGGSSSIFEEWQLDWETNQKENPTYMTETLNYLGSQVGTIRSSFNGLAVKLSVTSFPYDFAASCNPTAIEGPGGQSPIVHYLNDQAYTYPPHHDFQTFVNDMAYLCPGGTCIPGSTQSAGMEDENNADFAGQCLQYVIQNQIGNIAVWPNSSYYVMYPVTDTIYGNKTWYDIAAYFLAPNR